VEGLFPPGSHLRAADGTEMKKALRVLLHDRELAASLTATGLRTIAERHTCRHRVLKLLSIVDSIRGPRRSETASHLQEVLS
jgi:spore maturation protein CgeB